MNAADVVAQSVAAFALHTLWQVPLLAGAAWCAVRIGRPQARVAHAAWVGTLLLCVALPTGSTVAARYAARAAQRTAHVAISYQAMAFDGDLAPMQRQPAWQRILHRHVNARDGLQPFAVSVPERWARAITVAWLLATVFFSAQLCVGWKRMRALIRGASDDPLPNALAATLQGECERLHLAAPVAKLHDGIAGPVLAGVTRPALLLPAACVRDMAAMEVQAVLAHELAHLRRHDPMVHAACSLLLLPVCFHPAALWVARCVRQTREMACDAEAAERMGSPVNYAWALLQVAERTSTGEVHAAAPGLFSNGLFGAGLQLFTNRGAMEERMQMLMSGNGSKVRGRGVRVAAGVSLAAVAVIAATMLQVQPTLAAERGLPQATTTAAQVPVPLAQTTQEREPARIGGEHAREQLRRAQRQLVQAETKATNDEDRGKIEGAQQAIVAAQQALAAADKSPQMHFDFSSLDHLNVQLRGFQPADSAALQAGMAAQREAMQKLQAQMNSPEWKAQMQRLRTDAMESVRVQMNTPEFKAQMEQARKLDRTKIDAILADARKQREKAMEQIRSGELQRQIAEAQLMARVEPAPMPSPAALPAAPAAPATTPAPAAPQSAKPLQVKPGAIKILTKVDPTYPAEAKAAKTQGAVLLHVLIDEGGRVEQLSTISTPDKSLATAAVAAVQQWVFQPYLLNGNPVPVETTVTVNFSLVP